MAHAALGMIETYGYIGALAGADAAVKAAVVHIDRLEIVKGGIVTVFVVGDVGAVKAAVEAGEAEASRVGKFRRSHVIARVSDEVEAMLTKSMDKAILKNKLEETQIEIEVQMQVEASTTKANVIEAGEAVSGEAVSGEAEVALVEAVEVSAARVDFKQPKRTEDELKRMKVVKLRNIARSIDNISIDRNRIKFATKDELVKAILSSYERGKSDESR